MSFLPDPGTENWQNSLDVEVDGGFYISLDYTDEIPLGICSHLAFFPCPAGLSLA